jgi:hypothetical protein
MDGSPDIRFVQTMTDLAGSYFKAVGGRLAERQPYRGFAAA